MKYYVILIQTFNNGDADKKSIYEYVSESEAIANFHKNLGSAMTNVNIDTVLCMAINSVGGIYKNESWKNPVTPIPEAEEVVEDTTEVTE